MGMIWWVCSGTGDLLADMVDRVLREDDTNHDGYLDYAEYVEARTKAKPKPDQS